MTVQDLLNLVQIELLALPNLVIFFVALLLALLVGRYTPGLVALLLSRFSPGSSSPVVEHFIRPERGAFRLAGTLLLVSLSMVWLRESSPGLHDFFRPLVNLATIASVAWLVSRLFRQLVRVYGIDLLRRLGREVDELLLVFETLINVVIGCVAVLAFAQSQNFNLIGLIASLGIGGIAIGLAAQTILEQLLSTIVIYLDRPFIPGEYIRLKNGQLCRVESVGLRSTKIRTAAKSTLIIVPNSILIKEEIENISRAKKVMVLLYLDFVRSLSEEDAALVKQVVTQATNSLFGIDPGSTSITFSGGTESANGAAPRFNARRARVTFFILGSNDNSIQLRKRLLELANHSIAEQLRRYGIEFTVQDPTVYVESPITL
ncbi:MAG: mechanosensitive ion channel family protein [Leptolyngbya sp. DLM2.Bin27]|nr:MAG: mechanosensitive ion channel family protein [Leptolyngbya sp. DLM2.Bin27]